MQSSLLFDNCQIGSFYLYYSEIKKKKNGRKPPVAIPISQKDFA